MDRYTHICGSKRTTLAVIPSVWSFVNLLFVLRQGLPLVWKLLATKPRVANQSPGI